MVFSVGYIVDDSRTIWRRYKNAKGLESAIVAFLDMDILLHILIMVGCSLVFVGRILESKDCLEVGDVFIGFSSTMAVVEILNWLQLCSGLGPLIISIRRVVKDVILIGLAYCVFLLAFSIGMYHILHMSKELCWTSQTCPPLDPQGRF